MKIRSEQGFTSVDFLFSLIMAWGFIIVFFSLAFTFTAFEMAQYLAFSTARTYAGGHVSHQDQLELGEQKFAQLMQKKQYKALFNGTFFSITKPFTRDSQVDFNEEYEADSDSDRTFHGVQIQVNAHLLNRRLPFIGSTGDEPFIADITAFLGREITEQECIQYFNAPRMTQIMNLSDPDWGAAYKHPRVQVGAAQYSLITDNGC